MHGIVGYQPQRNAIDPELSVSQHIRLFAALAGLDKREQNETVQELLNDCNLTAFKDINTGSLSFGVQRRLTVAMALAGRPKLVILDNPVAGLDPISKARIIRTIKKYTEGRTLIIATRDVEVAETLADRLAIMHKGNFVAIGSQDEVLRNHGKGYALDVAIDPTERSAKII